MCCKKVTCPCFISFIQALGLSIYCGIVALLIWQGENLFGKMTSFWGPVLFLVLFAASALICGLIVLGYPIYLFWQKKERVLALKIIGYTAGWLVFFIILLIIGLTIF